MELSSFLRLLPLVLVVRNDFSDGGEIILENFASIVTVPENSLPGTKILEFQIVAFNDEIAGITVTSMPKDDYFLFTFRKTHQVEGTNFYTVEIYLNDPVYLDFEWIRMYILTITIDGFHTDRYVEQANLLVQDVPDERCGVQFQTPGGATVHVEETAAPLSQIYTIVSAPSPANNFTYTITDSVPASAKGEFSVDQTGRITVPLQGFGHKAEERKFELHISVTQNSEVICSGILRIIVTPVRHWPPIFTSAPGTVSILEKQGPEYYVAQVTATGNSVHYHLMTHSPAYKIGEESGIIRTSSNLDLDQNPGLAINLLVIIAFDDSYLYSSVVNVTVYVRDVNDHDPQCTPPIFVTEIPETTPKESILFHLTCRDPDYSKTDLSYSLVTNENSHFKFMYHANSVRLNESLDYDSAEMVGLGFRYTAEVIVTDAGTPPRTATVSVLVTVSQVNEFSPVFHGIRTFSVPENSPANTLVGIVNATDADWVYNNLRFSIVGHSPPTFYIHPYTGEINTLVPLDFERIGTYTLTIQAVDMNHNAAFDSFQQRTSYTQYTINVQNVNDLPPVCSPPFYKETIYSTRANDLPIVTLSCTDKDSELLNYGIIGGNINNRFICQGSSLFSRNTFSYNLDGISDPTTFELLIQVTDSNGADSKVVLTTTVIVIVHVVSWTTTTPSTTTPSATRNSENKIVTLLDKFWKPDAWFVVVLTLVSAMAAVALALLLRKCPSRSWCCKQTFPQAQLAEDLLQVSRSLPDAEAQKGNDTGGPTAEKKQSPSIISLSQLQEGLISSTRQQEPAGGCERSRGPPFQPLPGRKASVFTVACSAPWSGMG
ncbi:cadherin-related family member 4-like isoform X3 [Rhincodon typus]|uniref:cadherin-related family member 4-like isoform X3 n=1 Tax=Rhincodon typus TaxID=259920 RepID=UPI00202EFF6E|nr:cadherin-related family member 4-like isoform X3 [Rhincodon typus]